jgi:hypothetical protein
MFTYEPGTIYKGDDQGEPPIAIVARERAQVAAYVEAAPIGPWVWLREASDLPEERLGGVAMLDTEPIPDGLRTALVERLLL